MTIYRQGDVVLRTVEAKFGIYISSDKPVQRQGETGQTHSVQTQRTIQTLEGRTFVQAEMEGAIVHPEHAKVILPSGTYEVDSVRSAQPARTQEYAD